MSGTAELHAQTVSASFTLATVGVMTAVSEVLTTKYPSFFGGRILIVFLVTLFMTFITASTVQFIRDKTEPRDLFAAWKSDKKREELVRLVRRFGRPDALNRDADGWAVWVSPSKETRLVEMHDGDDSTVRVTQTLPRAATEQLPANLGKFVVYARDDGEVQLEGPSYGHIEKLVETLLDKVNGKQVLF